MPKRLFLIAVVILIALAITWNLHRQTKVVSPPPAPVAPAQPVVPKATIPNPLPKIAQTPVKVAEKPISTPAAPHHVSKKMPPPTPAATPKVVAPYVPPVETPVYTPEPPEPTEWKGTDTAIQHAGQIVIRTEEQWIHFWSEHHPHEASPDVDFTKHMVIGIFVGSRPAEGFSVSITRIQMLPNGIVADYLEQPPPPGTLALNETVYPYALKSIPRSSLPVKFNRTTS